MRANWNELHFQDRSTFVRMVPPIVRLEIDRLSQAIDEAGDDIDLRNACVRARHSLREFVNAMSEGVEWSDGRHLEEAVMALALVTDADDHKADRIDYVLDRLRYLHSRLPFIY